jgi:hypothetical protein
VVPGDGPSDWSLSQATAEELDGRLDILQDVHSDSQGMTGAYAFFAVLLPALLLASVYFDVGTSRENAGWMIGLAAVLFMAFTAVSLSSWAWCYWSRIRIERVEAEIRKRQNHAD